MVIRLTGWAVAAAIAWGGAAAADPVTVQDARNRTVTVPTPPQRIVSIFASNTEMIAALGMTDRIVGTESYTRYPPEVTMKPLVGGRLGFSVDAMVALKPDLVVVTPSRQAANLLVDPMERLGVPIVVLLQRDVAEIVANIRLLGRIGGVAERGEALAKELEARLARTRERIGKEPAPRVIMITGRIGNGLMLVTRPNTYTGDAIVLAGGRLGPDGLSTIAQISPEAILNADPDILLWAGTDAGLRDLIARPGWADMRAVKSKRAYAVSRPELLIPGPRTFDGIEHLAALFHPAAGR